MNIRHISLRYFSERTSSKHEHINFFIEKMKWLIFRIFRKHAFEKSADNDRRTSKMKNIVLLKGNNTEREPHRINDVFTAFV